MAARKKSKSSARASASKSASRSKKGKVSSRTTKKTASKSVSAKTARSKKKAKVSSRSTKKKLSKATAKKAASKTRTSSKKKVAAKKKATKVRAKAPAPKEVKRRLTSAKINARSGSGGSTADLEFFRQRLEEKRAELLSLYSHDLRAGTESNEDGTEDIVDRANNAYSRELLFSLSDGERAMLIEVEEALARMETGEFGICQHSRQPIPEERLRAVPWARYCIESQELYEKGLLE